MNLTWVISLRARSAGVSGVVSGGVVFLAAPRGNKAGLGFYQEIFYFFFLQVLIAGIPQALLCLQDMVDSTAQV